ncbi:MAG: nucleotidyltransferase domain-containing protein [Solirubrobacteraceae bacterium]
MIDEATIAEVGQRISDAAPSASVYLFGSHARGTAKPNSDLDILVVEPEVENAAEEAIRLRRALRGLRITADVVVVSQRDAEEWRDVRGSLIHSALSESRLIAA